MFVASTLLASRRLPIVAIRKIGGGGTAAGLGGAILALSLGFLLAGRSAAEHDNGLPRLMEPKPPAAPAGLASHLIEGQGKPHTLVLVDAKQKRVAVYHIDPDTGGMTLKSAREVSQDLLLEDFNSGRPTPKEIRDALGNP